MKTCDSGIAATFTRPCRVGAHDSNPVMANVEYVRYLEEIIQLNYQQLSVVVFLCHWVRANYHGQNATIKKDNWGFTLANFSTCLPFRPESLTLLDTSICT
jgi:hypothetical protein